MKEIPKTFEKSSDIKAFPLISKIPKRLRGSLYASATFAGISSIAAVCGADEGGQVPADEPSQNQAGQNLDPRRFLKYPLPRNADMRIQQGWDYSFNAAQKHQGIDYINGDVDGNNWETFPVLVAEPKGKCVLILLTGKERRCLSGTTGWMALITHIMAI